MSMEAGDTTNAVIAGAALTVTDAAAEAVNPNESVTFAASANVPVAVGVHVIVGPSTVVQPTGRPRYVHVSGAVLPVALAQRVKWPPRSIVAGLATSAIRAGLGFTVTETLRPPDQ